MLLKDQEPCAGEAKTQLSPESLSHCAGQPLRYLMELQHCGDVSLVINELLGFLCTS